MQFLGVGWQEILLVLVVTLIFVGPQRMPEMAYQIGRAVRTLQQYARAVRSEFSEEIGYIEEQYKTVRGEIDTTRQSFREQQRAFESEMREATKPIQELPQLISPDQPSNVVSIAERTNGAGASEALPAVVDAAPPEGSPAAEPNSRTDPPLLF